MLALQPVEQREPLLDLVEPAGRGLDRLPVPPQLAGQVVRLDGEGLRAVGQRVERRVDPAGGFEPVGRGGERRGGAFAAGVVPGQGGRRAAGRAQQRRDVAEPLALGQQRLLLGLAGIRPVDLLELPLEQVELAVARARAGAQGLELLAQRPLARVGGRERLPARGLIGAAEAVEDLELGAGQHQPPVLVLAVEGEQRAADLRQVGGRRAAAAEVRARATLGTHAPRQHELVRILGQPVGERVAQRGRQGEHALDVSLRRARSHDAGARLAAEQQVERMGEHRLARTGLAGEDVEARTEAQLGPLDQQQVLDSQLVQHAAGSISGCRRSRARAGGSARFRAWIGSRRGEVVTRSAGGVARFSRAT